ncbi:hypothetical protein VTK56DRAFT_2403 [Thermocarpiscus australiensis]
MNLNSVNLGSREKEIGKSRVEVKIRTDHSVIYVYRTEPNVVLKADSIWIDGVPYGTAPLAKDTSYQLRREHNIYQALGDSRYITRCLGLLEDDKGDAFALRLELAPKDNLRHFIRDTAKPPMCRRLEMAPAFTECVAYLHSRGVIWGDLSTRNTLVVDDNSTKICGFASSALENVYPQFGIHTYEPRYCPALPNEQVRRLSMLQRELYALGSAVYEITEWEVPYAHIGDDEDIWDVVEGGQMPIISNDNIARDIITRCWDYGYDSAGPVAIDLATLSQRLRNEPGHTDMTSDSSGDGSVRLVWGLSRIRRVSVPYAGHTMSWPRTIGNSFVCKTSASSGSSTGVCFSST